MHSYRSKNLTLLLREIESKRHLSIKLVLASMASNLSFPKLHRKMDVVNSYFPTIQYMKAWYGKHLTIDTHMIELYPIIKMGSFDGQPFMDVEFDLRKPSGWHKSVMILLLELHGGYYPIAMTSCRQVERGMRFTIPNIYQYSYDYMEENEPFNFKRLQ